MMTIMATGIVACDDESEKPQSITTEEAATIMATSVASNSYGVMSVLNQSAEVTADASGSAGGKVQATCGVLQNVSLSGSSPIDAVIKFSYDFSYKFQLDCDDQEMPTAMNVNLSYSSSFDGPNLTSELTGNGELLVAGLGNDQESFLVDGYFKRSGSIDTKGEEPKSISGTIEITIVDVSINKETHEIMDGILTVDINGTVEGKGDFKYAGVVTFDGTSTANLRLGNANFDLSLTTGVLSQK